MPTEREKLEEILKQMNGSGYDEATNDLLVSVDTLADYILANYTPKSAVPGDGDMRERVCTLLNQAVEDLGLAVLFRDQDPVDTAGAGDKNPPYYWTDKFMHIFASHSAAAQERAVQEALAEIAENSIPRSGKGVRHDRKTAHATAEYRAGYQAGYHAAQPKEQQGEGESNAERD